MTIFEIIPPNLFITIFFILSIILLNESIKHYRKNHQLTKLFQFLLMSIGGMLASIWKYLETYVDINEMFINTVKSTSILLIALGMVSGTIAVFKHGSKGEKKLGKFLLAYILLLVVVFLILAYIY